MCYVSVKPTTNFEDSVRKKEYKIFHIYFYTGTWQIDFNKYVLTKYIKILSIWSVQTIILLMCLLANLKIL